MSLAAQVDNQIKEAMKAKDADRYTALISKLGLRK